MAPSRDLLAPLARWTSSLALVLGLAGCTTAPPSGESSSRAATSGASAGAAPVLRIGVHAQLPPVVFRKGGEITGAEADLGRQLADHLKRRPHFVSLTWEELIPALLDGRIDIIMSGMSITDARRARVDFCDPWLRAGQSALVRRSDFSTMRFGLITGNYRIGSQKATTGGYFAEQNLHYARRSDFSSPEAGARALASERIDAFIHDLPINLWLASENEASGLVVLDLLLTEEYLAWAVRRDDTDLRAAANEFIARIKADGTLAATVRRWLPGYLNQ